MSYCEESTPINFDHNSTIIDLNANECTSNEYFNYKRLINKSYYNSYNCSIKLFKNRCKLFDRPNPNALTLFEKFLISSDDKSAIISLIVRSFNLWNDEEFWTQVVKLEDVMKHYAKNEDANIKNFLSILLFDWHSLETVNEKEMTTHVLDVKFKAYEKFEETIFRKLLKIFDDEKHKGYHYVCLRIVYQFLYEINGKISRKVDDEVNKDKVEEFRNIVQKLIMDTLSMKNNEYKVKLLKILTVFLHNSSDEYEILKSKISIAVKCNLKITSIYRVSIDCIEQICDEKFFELVFFLKESLLKKFEFELGNYIKIYQKFHGEYWKIAMEENAALLNYLINEQSDVVLLKTRIYFSSICNFIDKIPTIFHYIKRTAEFCVVLNEPLSEKESQNLSAMNEILKYAEHEKQQFYKNKLVDKLNQKLLFGRKSVNESSMLEQILSKSQSNRNYAWIWKKFCLFEKPQVLNFKNPMGRRLLHYILEPRDADQLFSFLLLFKSQPKNVYHEPKHLMVYLNALVSSITNRSIIQWYLDVQTCEFFVRIQYLLEEIGMVKEIKDDSLVDQLIDQINTENNSKNLFEAVLTLATIITYWKPNGVDYKKYKQKLENIPKVGPFFELLFMITDRDAQKFIENFSKSIEELEEVYKSFDMAEEQKNMIFSLCELNTTNFIYTLFLAALRTNQSDLVECILASDSFTTAEYEFPENIKPQDIHFHAALIFLNRQYELGYINIPDSWLTRDVLNKFLNSRVTYHNTNFVEMDCTFITDTKYQKIDNEDDQEVTFENTNVLQYIRKRENLEDLMIHPLIETYINLTSYKYQRIFEFNFLMFLLLYILPFVALIAYNHIGSSDDPLWNFFVGLYRFHHIGVVYLLCRELFRYSTSRNIKEYLFQMLDNSDIMLLIFSIALSFCTTFGVIRPYIMYLEASIVLSITVNATSMLPSVHVPLNIKILKKVSMTFLRLFYTFSIILIGFCLSFFIIFESSADHKRDYNFKNSKNDESESTDSFAYLHSSFVKFITILSGEYAMEPVTFSFAQLLFFTIFVISSFILYNLILGLSIEDVQNIKLGSRMFMLRTKAKRIINVEKELAVLDGRIENPKNNYIKRIVDSISSKIIKFLLSGHVNINNIQKIYINMNTREIYVNFEQRCEPIFKKRILKSGYNFQIDDVTLNGIKKIIENGKLN